MSGNLVQLRPLKAGEFESLFLAASDPRIWEQHPSPLRYQREVFQKFFDDALASKGALAILDAQTSRVIGSSRYYEYNPQLSEVVIGYTFLTREFWGGPANRELKTLMLDHAFQYVDHVLFHVGATNRRSQKAMEKIGGELIEKKFKLDCGEKREDYFIYRIGRLRNSASDGHKPD